MFGLGADCYRIRGANLAAMLSVKLWENGGIGGNTTVINNGVGLTFGVGAPANAWTYLLTGSSTGGNGGFQSNSKYNAGAGGSGGGIALTNNFDISASFSASVGYGLSGVSAIGFGGNGGNVQSKGNDSNNNPTYDGGLGGAGSAGASGGTSGPVSVTNSAPVEITWT